MKPVLRYLHSPDTPNLCSYAPAEPEFFGILVQAMVGPQGEHGEESFDFVVCSPSWFDREILADSSYVFGQSYLFMKSYSYSLLVRVIDGLLDSVEGKDWHEIANKLGRYSHWEFEDYKPQSSKPKF